MNPIKAYLVANKMRVDEFAKKLGVKPISVYRWITLAMPVSIERAVQIEALFGIPAESLSSKIKPITDMLDRRSSIMQK